MLRRTVLGLLPWLISPNVVQALHLRVRLIPVVWFLDVSGLFVVVYWCWFHDSDILFVDVFLLTFFDMWPWSLSAQALTPSELALKSELEAQRRVLSKVGRWSQWNHGGPWWAPGSDGKFRQGRLGNMGNAIGEYWKWEMNSLFVLLFDTLTSISQGQMLMGDYQVAKMECVYVCLADDVEKVWNNKTIDFLVAVWERKLDTTGGVITGQMMVNPPDTSICPFHLPFLLFCCHVAENPSRKSCHGVLKFHCWSVPSQQS